MLYPHLQKLAIAADLGFRRLRRASLNAVLFLRVYHYVLRSTRLRYTTYNHTRRLKLSITLRLCLTVRAHMQLDLQV